MTDDQKDHLLADCLEDYHREKARGELPDLQAYRERLGDLFEEFQELVAAETIIDEALDAGQEETLPRTWGEYTLLDVLGRGGAGIVYEALHRKLGRKVALKILRTGVDTDSTQRERFRREAQSLAQVRHDHIVEIYEYGEVGGHPYYAMTLIEGPTLTELLKSGKLPTPQELCSGLAGVADALHVLHEADIIHRDVKPGNIMIAPNGRYILADFGLARSDLAATMTRTGDALGTPLYMSPEQMLGQQDAIVRQTDVYGLGATLYQLLTGQPPFKTQHMHALMRMIIKERPEAARSVNPELPVGCNAVVMKCLEKEPRDRYETAAALAEDLRACAAGNRVAGRPLTRFERGLRWTRNHAKYVAAAAVVLAALGAYLQFKPVEDGWLTLTPFPEDARILAQFEGEESWRDVPFNRLPIKPNVDHTIKLRGTQPGFGLGSLSVRVKPDSEYDGVARVKMDYDSPNFWRVYRGEVPASTKKMETQRSSAAPDLEIAFPRGRARMEDLGHWQIFISDAFDPEEEGTLKFLHDGKVVATQPFPEATDFVVSGPIPAKALEAWAQGGKASWGFVRGHTKLYTDFEIVPTDAALEEDLQKIDERLAREKAEKMIVSTADLRPTLRTLAFLKHGLDMAAWNEIQPRVLLQVIQPTEVNPNATKMQVHLLRVTLERLYPKRDRLESSPWMGLLEARKLYGVDSWAEFDQQLQAK